ncbi:ATP-binding cassette sub- A member 5 [Rhizophlyctis rosea]|uniref:ATP-binding cassette sub- A member 5 n=1 Tax=Rhizophlyctis rosea TaxID=64517 RepID=A0AAD5S4E8_9FUNG|nr:ATP-binding cassette sub- A member 5 [Rhizophlyctis rosea]
MLCGLIPASSGTAKIYGKDIREDMDEIRQMMGVCPQHDILFEDLSVREHLLIFACLKGYPLPPFFSIFKHLSDTLPTNHKTYTRISQIISEIDLVEKTETASKSLSGGQKRKLSVGMAMVGEGVKVLVLDEPSSGMDPFSRRKLWDLLGRTKAGRITILSTHFMDEADVLADRKAILSKGRVRCLGTSLFLKKRFGIGYWLDVGVKKGRVGEVGRVVGGLVGAVGGVRVQVGNEEVGLEGAVDAALGSEEWGDVTTLRWELPAEEVDRFPELFRELDRVVEDQGSGVEGYGLSMPTLEQVFLKSAQEEAEEVHEGEEGGSKSLPWIGGGVGLPSLKDEDFRPKSNFTDFKAMMRLRYVLHFREIQGLLFRLVFPIVLTLVSLLLAPRTQGAADPNTTGTNPSRPLTVTSPTLFYDPTGNATDAQAILGRISPQPRAVEGNFYNWVTANKPQTAGYKVSSLAFPPPFGTIYTPILYHNASTVDALPASLNLFSNAVLSSIDPAAPQISATLHPLPNTQNLWAGFDGRAFAAVLLLGMALALPAVSDAISCVAERENRVVGQLYVMGLKRWVYWASTFLVDWSLFFIVPVIMIIIIVALKIASFSGPALAPVAILLLLHLPNSLIFSYFISLFFNRAETARSVMAAPIQLYVIVPYLIVSLTFFADPNNKVSVICHYIFATIMPYYAMTGGLWWVQKIGIVRSFVPEGVLPPLKVSDFFLFENHIMGTILIMLAQMIIYSCGVLYVDFWKTRVTEGMIKDWDRNEISDLRERRERDGHGVEEKDDEDVVLERRRVAEEVKGLGTGGEAGRNGEDLEMSGTGFDEILVGDVRKEFGKKVAVEWNSWGVRKGEVFALLGPNGAGKTTTLSMAIGETIPTHGKVYIHTRSIFSKSSNAFQYMGYCPQFDGLWPLITVQEHLALFATIKGVSPQALQGRVDSLMKVLDIEQFKEKRSRDLSGGNRRKLSFAVAVVGEPKAIFLDEPSTGVDPGSRRWMWELIGELKKGRAVVLTTHSMEEADALSTRIAIQVSGRLRCIGTPQHLKTKFGSGYQLEIASSPLATHTDNGAQVHSSILQLFPSAILLEHFGGVRRYRVPSEDVKKVGGLGGVFDGLKGLRGDGAAQVTDYAFSQTTLDQVFIEFAKRQEDEDLVAGAKDGDEGKKKGLLNKLFKL